MNNGLITDTVLHLGRGGAGRLGGVAFINLMFVLFLPLSFLIPSSSGLATVAMPIMAPLAAFAGLPAQLVVTAYQSASGLVNLVTPTSAVVMGGLAIARVGMAPGSSSCGRCSPAGRADVPRPVVGVLV